jgi:hypothetical protein
VAGDHRARAAPPDLRGRHLRRGGLDPRPHAADRGADRRETSLTVVAHLTCVGTSREQLREIIGDLARAGIRNVLALRGDPPSGPGTTWEPHPEGLHHASELVELLHEEGDFCVGVAAHPELHPESPDLDSDVKHFAGKCAAGADFAVTQFFFDTSDYFRFVDAARAGRLRRPGHPRDHAGHERRADRAHGLLSGADFPTDLAARLHESRTTRRPSAPSAWRSPPSCAGTSSPGARRDPLLHAEPLDGDARDLRPAPSRPRVTPRHPRRISRLDPAHLA